MRFTNLTHQLTWKDLLLIKAFCIILGIIIGGYIAGFVTRYSLWLVVLLIIFAAKPVHTIWKTRDKKRKYYLNREE
ncbi:MAG: hypothetical protein ABIH52_04005 [Candidatus Aenigmatarchaeota archaeon]